MTLTKTDFRKVAKTELDDFSEWRSHLQNILFWISFPWSACLVTNPRAWVWASSKIMQITFSLSCLSIYWFLRKVEKVNYGKPGHHTDQCSVMMCFSLIKSEMTNRRMYMKTARYVNISKVSRTPLTDSRINQVGILRDRWRTLIRIQVSCTSQWFTGR